MLPHLLHFCESTAFRKRKRHVGLTIAKQQNRSFVRSMPRKAVFRCRCNIVCHTYVFLATAAWKRTLVEDWTKRVCKFFKRHTTSTAPVSRCFEIQTIFHILPHFPPSQMAERLHLYNSPLLCHIAASCCKLQVEIPAVKKCCAPWCRCNSIFSGEQTRLINLANICADHVPFPSGQLPALWYTYCVLNLRFGGWIICFYYIWGSVIQ